jgi:hypothetical protein
MTRVLAAHVTALYTLVGGVLSESGPRSWTRAGQPGLDRDGRWHSMAAMHVGDGMAAMAWM